MPIRIDYSPIRDLLNLAQAAGAGAARQRQEAGDLAYTQMVMGQQARYAETAARLQASDRAFALQRAAMSRAARTPTRAGALPGPIAAEMVRAQRQEQQLEQLQTTYAAGGMSNADLERAKLDIIAGRKVVAPIPAPKPVNVTQQIGLWKDRWNQVLKPLAAQIDRMKKEILKPYDVLDEDGKIDPVLQRQETYRTEAIGKQLRAAEAKQAALFRQKEQDEMSFRAGIEPQATGAARELTGVRPVYAQDPNTPIPLPARQAEWVAGQVYTAPDGRVGRWDGSKFTEVR